MTADRHEDLKKTLWVVIYWLKAKSYDIQERHEGLKNGRWIHDWCMYRLKKKTSCPKCIETELKELFTMLEQGYQMDGEALVEGDSDWDRTFTNSALDAGRFPKWEEE